MFCLLEPGIEYLESRQESNMQSRSEAACNTTGGGEGGE